MHSRYLVFVLVSMLLFLSGCHSSGSRRPEIEIDAPSFTPQAMAIPTTQVPPAETADVSESVAEDNRPYRQPAMVAGKGFTEADYVRVGELGEHCEVAVKSALLDLNPAFWYHRFSREHFTFGAGEIIQLRSGELTRPLFPSAKEAELHHSLRTHHYEGVIFYISGRNNRNPLGLVVSDDGRLLEMRPVMKVSHIDPALTGGAYGKRPVFHQLFHDPYGNNGVNVLLVFRVRNEEAANRALAYEASYNYLIGDERVPAHLAGDPEAAPISIESWYLGIKTHNFDAIQFLPSEDGGQPTLAVTHRSSESLKDWELSVLTKELHNSDCTGSNCHPDEGMPEICDGIRDGVQIRGCYVACGIRTRYDFNEGDLTPSYFGRFMPNGDAQDLEVVDK